MVNRSRPRKGTAALALATLACLSVLASRTDALTLTGGPVQVLAGPAGTIEVAVVDDNPIINGALTSGGLIPGGLGIPVVRVPYDVLNDFGIVKLCEFAVEFDLFRKNQKQQEHPNSCSQPNAN